MSARPTATMASKCAVIMFLAGINRSTPWNIRYRAAITRHMSPCWTDTDLTKQLLIVAHAPSPNTRRLRDALVDGARSADVTVQVLSPFDTGPEQVLSADGIILSTTENLGYMSGALKDFFDRIYYPTLEHKQGTPYALQIRAGNDGLGTQRAVETIVTGLRWRAVQAALICRGEFKEAFVTQCHELGAAMAAGLEAGIL